MAVTEERHDGEAGDPHVVGRVPRSVAQLAATLAVLHELVAVPGSVLVLVVAQPAQTEEHRAERVLDPELARLEG